MTYIVTPQTNFIELLDEALGFISQVTQLNDQAQDLKERLYKALRELEAFDPL